MSTQEDRSASREESRASTLLRTWTAIEGLTDDLVVEILVRVPFRSLCRFRCVSKHWLGLIDNPDNRKRLPRTLAGFFHPSTRTTKSALGFVNVSGGRSPPIDVSFSFLPNNRHVEFLDCCNGLLLCRWYHVPGDDFVECCYVVCNPATREWAVLPNPSHAPCRFGLARLGFDPAVSSNFYVFLLLPAIKDDGYMIAGVEAYSSETRRWAYKKEGWNKNIMHSDLPSTVFINGCLHFHAYNNMLSRCLAAVDTKGESWTIFCIPGDLRDGFLQQSQGCLHYSSFQIGNKGDVAVLVVYVLKDYDNKEWILKHSVQNSQRPGGTHLTGYDWIVIHPQRDMMFFTERWATKFVCYNMDRQQIKVISNLEYGDPPYLPYVPFYARLQSLQK